MSGQRVESCHTVNKSEYSELGKAFCRVSSVTLQVCSTYVVWSSSDQLQRWRKYRVRILEYSYIPSFSRDTVILGS